MSTNRYLFILFAACVMFSCKTEEEDPRLNYPYLPQLVWQITGGTIEEAQTTLAAENFELAGNSNGQLLYKKDFYGSALGKGAWYVEFSNSQDSVEMVLANQTTELELAGTMCTEWDKLCKEHHMGYTLWAGELSNSDSTIVYMDGQAVALLSGALVAALILNQITQEQYDEISKLFKHSRTEFLEDLKTFDFYANEAGFGESFINLTDTKTRQGTLSGLYFGNYNDNNTTATDPTTSSTLDQATAQKGITIVSLQGDVSQYVPVDNLDRLIELIELFGK